VSLQLYAAIVISSNFGKQKWTLLAAAAAAVA